MHGSLQRIPLNAHKIRKPQLPYSVAPRQSQMAEKISGSNLKSAAVTMNSHLEMNKPDRNVWLMKCPTLVSTFFQQHLHSSSTPLNIDNDGLSSFVSPAPVAKVVVAVDPLLSNDATQVPTYTCKLILKFMFFSLLCFASFVKNIFNLSLFFPLRTLYQCRLYV